MTILDLFGLKQKGQKISAVSCYDYTTARLVGRAGVDMILVGDSAAQILLGHDSTLPATMDLMVALTTAVRRGAPNVCLVADMPFCHIRLRLQALSAMLADLWRKPALRSSKLKRHLLIWM